MRRVEFDCFSGRFPLSKIELTVVNSSSDFACVRCSMGSSQQQNTMYLCHKKLNCNNIKCQNIKE